jgi:hypothetical protein
MEVSCQSITQNSGQSPFDQIRHFDERGNEFWLARELMKLLGYKQWRSFSPFVEQGLENLEASVGSVEKHFLRLSAKSQGRDAEDWQLSRLAAYHVTLACNGKGKPIVKQAKHYFAVKTHEAEEATQPQLSGDSIIDMAHAIIAQRQEILRLEQEQAELREAIVAHDAELERISNPYGRYYTAMAYANLKGIPNFHAGVAQQVGRQCSKYCRDHEIPIYPVKDVRWGQINSYPESVLEICFG